MYVSRRVSKSLFKSYREKNDAGLLHVYTITTRWRHRVFARALQINELKYNPKPFEQKAYKQKYDKVGHFCSSIINRNLAKNVNNGHFFLCVRSPMTNEISKDGH